MITMSILQYILCDILLVCGGIQLGMLIVKIINAQEKKQKKKGEKMPPKETHEIKMIYAVYADGRKEPIVIDEIKDFSLEEAEPILEEHNFVKVVRCKDCTRQMICFHSDDYFCADGERREDV